MQDNDQNSDDLSNSSSIYEEGSNTGGNNDKRSQDDLSNSLNNSKSSVSQGNGIRSNNNNKVNAFFMPYNTTNMLSESTFASPSSVIDGNYTSAVGPLGSNVDVDATATKLLNFTINPNKNNVSNKNSPNSFQPSQNGNQRNDNNRFLNDNGNLSNENEDFLKPDLSFLDSGLGGNSYNGINSNQTNSPL